MFAAARLDDAAEPPPERDRPYGGVFLGALGLSLPTARSRMRDAEQLCTPLPGTLAALMAGSISCLQARAVTDASYVLDAGLLAEYQARVLKHAPEQTLAQLKQSIRRAALRLDPATAEQRRQRARADRHIRVADAGHGMGWLVLLPIAT